MFIIIHKTIDSIAEITRSRLLIFLMKNPATSYVAGTFHPTIGQRAHQSLSNAATPELGMIPPRIRVNAGLHLARGHTQQTKKTGFIKPSIDQPSLHIPKTNHCLHAAKPSLHSPVKKQRRPGIIPNKWWAQLKPTRQHRVVLGPTVAKTTRLQPKPGYSSSQKHTMNDISNPQSQNRETQPTDWKSTVAQNEIEHHNQQNVGKTTAPKHKQWAWLTTWENDPKQSVREGTCTRPQNTEENIYTATN